MYGTLLKVLHAGHSLLDAASRNQLMQYLEELSAKIELPLPMSLLTANVGPLPTSATACMPLPLLGLNFCLLCQ